MPLCPARFPDESSSAPLKAIQPPSGDQQAYRSVSPHDRPFIARFDVDDHNRHRQPVSQRNEQHAAAARPKPVRVMFRQRARGDIPFLAFFVMVIM